LSDRPGGCVGLRVGGTETKRQRPARSPLLRTFPGEPERTAA
jgi:hypothetical protein